MATAEPVAGFLRPVEHAELAGQWRRLRRAATAVALLTSPAAFIWFHRQQGWPVWVALLATVGVVIGFRATVDLVVRQLIPWPSLFGLEDPRLKEEDVVNRRRSWFWRTFAIYGGILAVVVTVVYVVQLALASPGDTVTWTGAAASIWDGFVGAVTSRQFWIQLLFISVLFFANFAIFFGPLLLLGISQIRGYQPGDADWGRSPRRRARPGRGEGGSAADRQPLAVGRGLRAGGWEARAWIAVPRPAGDRQDDARQGDRDRVQLAVRHDPRLRVRSGLHRHRRDHRPLPRAEGAQARQEVGRPVHRLHRRDRRGRAPAPGAAGTALDAAAPAPLGRLLRAVRRPDSGDPRLARRAVRAPRARAARRPSLPPAGGQPRQPGVSRGVRRHGPAVAEPAARDDGRDRQPALLQASRRELRQRRARRDLHHPPHRGPHGVAASAPAATEGADLLHRGDERPDRGARRR